MERDSFRSLDALISSLGLDPAGGLLVLDARQPERLVPVTTVGMVLTWVHNQTVAREARIRLTAHYPDEHQIWLVQAAGVPESERLEEIPLYELGRQDWLDSRTSVYVPPTNRVAGEFSLTPLVGIMTALRGENGCPWDREQTHASIGRYLIEETYEVLDAIERKNMHNLREELGDLLLQVVFHAQMARENGHFDIDDVIRVVCEKMIYRHPHVFGEKVVRNSDEVLANWERLKSREKGTGESVLSGVPRNLPALLRSDRVQSKAARLGFDWPDFRGALDKLDEEREELREVLVEGDQERITEELGDLLFAAVNVARLVKVDAEEALRLTVDKFTRRFALVEEKYRAAGGKSEEITLSEMDEWWESAKKLEKS